MDEWYPGVREEIRAFVQHIDDLEPLEWVEIPENCNWKVSIENYSECYHCPTNHPTFAEGVVKPETYDIQPDAGGGYVLRHTTECQSLDKMTYPVDLSVPHAGDYQSWFLWPMFSFQCYPGNVLNTYHWRASRCRSLHRLARLVHRGWLRKRGDPTTGRAGPGDHSRGRHPSGRKRPSRPEIPRVSPRSARAGPQLWGDVGTLNCPVATMDARGGGIICARPKVTCRIGSNGYSSKRTHIMIAFTNTAQSDEEPETIDG